MRGDALKIFVIGLAAAIGLGIGRFAYSLVIPEMYADLNWNYSKAGWMNTSNAAGYLIGALVTASVTKRLGLWRTLSVGIWLTVLSLFAMALTTNFLLLNVGRFIAGTSGAFCFVAGGVIAASIASRATSNSNHLLAHFYAGPGVGIILSGLLVPLLLSQNAASMWPLAWVVLGIIAVFLGVLCMTARGAAISATASMPKNAGNGFAIAQNLPILLGYGAFGAGYIGYMTFIFTLLKDLGASVSELMLFWSVVGLATMAAPWLWAGVLQHFKHGYAMASLTAITLLGAILPLFYQRYAVILLSGVIFGAAFFSVPASTTIYVRRTTAAADWPRAIGVMTVAFSLGQIIGPVLVGHISDGSGNLLDGLLWGCVFLAMGIGFSSLQRDPA
jgi:predicted MFS family arabinose efflux permease